MNSSHTTADTYRSLSRDTGTGVSTSLAHSASESVQTTFDCDTLDIGRGVRDRGNKDTSDITYALSTTGTMSRIHGVDHEVTHSRHHGTVSGKDEHDGGGEVSTAATAPTRTSFSIFMRARDHAIQRLFEMCERLEAEYASEIVSPKRASWNVGACPTDDCVAGLLS